MGSPWAGWKGADGGGDTGAPWAQWRGLLRRPWAGQREGHVGTVGWVMVGVWRHPKDHPARPSPGIPVPPQDTGLASTSLRTLTERLQEVAQGIQSLVQEALSAGDAPQQPSLTLLARVIDLVGAAKELFSWLNRSGAGEGTPGCWVPSTLGAQVCLPTRYLFSTLNDFSASRDIILLCAQLAETLQAVSAQGWLEVGQNLG